MSNHHRLTRRETESILDAPVESTSALGGLLGALRAPGRPGELRREDAAVAAFHSARLTPVSSTRSVMTTPRKAATRAVVATGIVVTLTSGGFALAATGNLPVLPGQASDQASESVAKDRAASAEGTRGASPSEKAVEAAESETEAPDEALAPTPNFRGLCTAFQSSDKASAGKSLDSAAFTALATEAGGKENIATYCVSLIGEAKAKPSQAANPSQAGKPTVLPTPTEKPTPAVKPTPTEKPTPAVKPTPTEKPTPAVKPTPTEKPTQEADSSLEGQPTNARDGAGRP